MSCAMLGAIVLAVLATLVAAIYWMLTKVPEASGGWNQGCFR